jgi:hypothetical protein
MSYHALAADEYSWQPTDSERHNFALYLVFCLAYSDFIGHN